MVSTPLKNISQNGNLPQLIGVKKNVWNHHQDQCSRRELLNFRDAKYPPIAGAPLRSVTCLVLVAWPSQQIRPGGSGDGLFSPDVFPGTLKALNGDDDDDDDDDGGGGDDVMQYHWYTDATCTASSERPIQTRSTKCSWKSNHNKTVIDWCLNHANLKHVETKLEFSLPVKIKKAWFALEEHHPNLSCPTPPSQLQRSLSFPPGENRADGFVPAIYLEVLVYLSQSKLDFKGKRLTRIWVSLENMML